MLHALTRTCAQLESMNSLHCGNCYVIFKMLQDKWKTLVHTARISPQQRRGEPVPQELLDRVLSAHAYWSQQQCKHQFKSM